MSQLGRAITRKATGLEPRKFSFEIVVHRVTDLTLLPYETDDVIVEWTRGPKMAVTKTIPKSEKSGSILIFEERLRMMSSLYYDPKKNEYSEKLAKISVQSKGKKKKEYGSLKLNLGDYALLADKKADPQEHILREAKSFLSSKRDLAGHIVLTVTSSFVSGGEDGDTLSVMSDMTFMTDLNEVNAMPDHYDEDDERGRRQVSASDLTTPSERPGLRRLPAKSQSQLARLSEEPDDALALERKNSGKNVKDLEERIQDLEIKLESTEEEARFSEEHALSRVKAAEEELQKLREERDSAIAAKIAAETSLSKDKDTSNRMIKRLQGMLQKAAMASETAQEEKRELEDRLLSTRAVLEQLQVMEEHQPTSLLGSKGREEQSLTPSHQSTINKLVLELDDAKANIHKLEVDLSKSVEESKSAKKQREEAESALRAETVKVNSLQATVTTLQATVDSHKRGSDRVSALEAQVAEQNATILRHIESIATLKIANSTATKNAAAATAALETATINHNKSLAAANANSKPSKSAGILSDDDDALYDSDSVIEDDEAVPVRKPSSLKKESEKPQKSKSSVSFAGDSAEIGKLRTENTKLHLALSTATDKEISLTKECACLKSEIATLQSSLLLIKSENARLKSELEDGGGDAPALLERVKRTESSLIEAKMAWAEAENGRMDLDLKLRKYREQYAVAINNLEVSLGDSRRQLEESLKDRDALATRMMNCQLQVADARDAFTNAVREVERLNGLVKDKDKAVILGYGAVRPPMGR